MSPAALEVAIAALEAEVVESELWERAAEENLDGATELAHKAQQQVEDAAVRVQNSREALDYLRGMKDAQAGADGLSEGSEWDATGSRHLESDRS